MHAHLSKHIPQIKLGQVHQILAACLGHRTYASLQFADLNALNQRPRYALFDMDAGKDRALDLRLPLTEIHWQEVTMLLSPSGVTPFWLTTVAGMHRAAQLTFEDYFDFRILQIENASDFPNTQRATSSRSHTEGDQVPSILRFDVNGEVQIYIQDALFAISVFAVVDFKKIGNRMYDEGRIVSAKQSGDPRLLTPDEAEDGCCEEYGPLSDD